MVDGAGKHSTDKPRGWSPNQENLSRTSPRTYEPGRPESRAGFPKGTDPLDQINDEVLEQGLSDEEEMEALVSDHDGEPAVYIGERRYDSLEEAADDLGVTERSLDRALDRDYGSF